MVTTLTAQATLTAVDAQARLESLTREPELGALAPVEMHIVMAGALIVVIVLCVVGLVVDHLGLLG
jgi:hypothetical protein